MRSVFLILALVLLLPATAEAQALPDLAPREVEIQGELTIAFPSLRRQPLVGFNPPPRVPEIDLRRMPFVEAYKQDGADLPQNPLANPTTPRALPRAEGDGFTGTFETGFGRYSARYALLEASLYASSTARWTVDGSYDGQTSYAPFGMDAGADGIRGGTAYTTSGEGLSFGIEGRGASESYNMYGADTAGGSSLANPERTRSDLSGSLWVGSGSASRMGYRLEAEAFSGQTETAAFVDRTDDSAKRTDSGFAGSASLSAGSFRLDANGGTLRLDGEDGVQHFDAGAGLRLRIGSGAMLFIGGRALGFEAQAVANGSHRRALTYASPLAVLEAELAPNIRLEVTQRPSLSDVRPGRVLAEAPFLLDEFHVEPVVFPVDVKARVRGFFGDLQLSGVATYRESPNWRVYEHAPSNYAGYARGLTRVRHTAARTLSVGAEARLSPSPGVETRLGARVQDGRMTDLEQDLPYFASWTVDGMVSVAFSQRKGLLQATTEVFGPRSGDAAGTLDVPTYADLDLRLSYSVRGNALIALELRNLLGETPVWYNYPEPPATVLFGVGWRW
ncbi:MAG: TonB-dependent receptor [Rhodothermales bacterium]|nr:TonB-dependent receptor [Rhodothermales bacterium]MBO6779755.1 TonB-dependent receptor [Rhodothermales bacterium]